MPKTNKFDAHMERASKFVVGGKLDEAIEEYTRAIEVKDKPFAHLMRASTYGAMLMGQAEYIDQKIPIAKASLPDLNLVIKILQKTGEPPNFPYGLKDFYLIRGLAHTYLKNSVNAIADLDAAISLDPNNADFYSARGGIYLDLVRNPEKAADDFKSSIAILPSATAYLFLAWSYIDMRDFEKVMVFVHIAAQMDMDVLDLEREHDDYCDRQWKIIRSKYIPYLQRQKEK